MYRVLCDGKPIYDLRDESLVLIDPQLVLEVNSAGSFSFKMPPEHPQYDLPVKMKSCIQVFQDDVELFNGRIINQKTDFYNRKYLECEGQLAFLNDSIQRPKEYHDMTVRGYLEALIAIHNSQVEESKQFEVGIVTVKDTNDSLYRYTNYNSTMKEIKEDLIDDLGGYIRIRNFNGHRYIDYIEEYENTNTQSIEFGENLLDFSRNINVADIATAIIPLGARKEESSIAALEERVTISEVNGGVDYLYNTEAVNTYGWITKTVIWDDVTTPAMLKSKAQRWLSDYQWESMVLEAQAVDLHYTDKEIETFKLGDKIRVHSSLHGLDRYFPLTKLTIYLNKLANNKITLGSTVKVSLSAKTNSIDSAVKKTAETIPVPSAIVQQAIDEATALITAATHGHVVTTAEEQLIMDTNDVNTATKVWRWNLNGFGYSSNGYNGTYKTAITMDGWIVGERIAANSISGDKLDITYTTQVEKEIADAEEAARSDAEDYTDGQLKNYYTKSQVETSIKNSADAVTLSAKETATQYVDGKLKNYYTSAQIDVKTNKIESTVSQKLNSSDLSTKIQQSATAVKIAWNNISKYIQFESGELRIYDSAVQSTQKIVSKFNSTGEHFYRDNIYLGKIGTNSWSGDSSFRGLVFDLEYNVGYMCWSAKDSASANVYTVKLIYYHNNNKEKKGLHFSCPTYADGNLYLTDSENFVAWSNGGCGFRGKMSWCNRSSTSSVEIDGLNKSFKVFNGVSINFYSTLNLNGWGYTNNSDARLKKNIVPTAIKGLEVVNGIDLKEFDWIQTNEHQDIGIIAQQILPIAPELVGKDEKDGHLVLKADKLVYYCIKAIQELCERLNMPFDKPEWSDPYSLLQKKEFCARLSPETATDEPIIKEPVKLYVKN